MSCCCPYAPSGARKPLIQAQRQLVVRAQPIVRTQPAAQNVSDLTVVNFNNRQIICLKNRPSLTPEAATNLITSSQILLISTKINEIVLISDFNHNGIVLQKMIARSFPGVVHVGNIAMYSVVMPGLVCATAPIGVVIVSFIALNAVITDIYTMKSRTRKVSPIIIRCELTINSVGIVVRTHEIIFQYIEHTYLGATGEACFIKLQYVHEIIGEYNRLVLLSLTPKAITSL